MRTLSKLATDEFPWKSNTWDEDLMCEIDNYCLRVEQMDKSRWWWCVLNKGELIPTLSNMTTSKYRAIGLAEGTYLGHSITNNL